MLSGEGNAGERWKTAIGLISKKTTLHVQHTFLYISLPLFCTTTSWNLQKLFFMEEMSYVFSFTFFFTAVHFLLALVAASISHFVTTATKFSCFSSTKKMSPLLLSLALDLSRRFSRWASLACRLSSLFLCLSLALYSKFVDVTINLSLIL